MTDPHAVSRAVTACVERLDGLDVLINNAGVGAQGAIEETTMTNGTTSLTDVIGIVRVSREALPALRESRRAAIVNVSSIVATLGLPGRALYAASKGAVHALTLHWQRTSSYTGYASTPSLRVPPTHRGLLGCSTGRKIRPQSVPHLSWQPHGRLIAPREIATAIAFLASPSSGSITGTTVAVDGGMIGLRPTGQARRSPRLTVGPSDRRP